MAPQTIIDYVVFSIVKNTFPVKIRPAELSHVPSSRKFQLSLPVLLVLVSLSCIDVSIGIRDLDCAHKDALDPLS
jgi:hypothetical protein